MPPSAEERAPAFPVQSKMNDATRAGVLSAGCLLLFMCGVQAKAPRLEHLNLLLPRFAGRLEPFLLVGEPPTKDGCFKNWRSSNADEIEVRAESADQCSKDAYVTVGETAGPASHHSTISVEHAHSVVTCEVFTKPVVSLRPRTTVRQVERFGYALLEVEGLDDQENVFTSLNFPSKHIDFSVTQGGTFSVCTLRVVWRWPPPACSLLPPVSRPHHCSPLRRHHAHRGPPLGQRARPREAARPA